MSGKRAIVLLSGGLDSSTLLYHCREKLRAEEILSLSFEYGQKHARELASAQVIAMRAGVGHEVIPLSPSLLFLEDCGSSLTDPEAEVPEGHYEDDSMRSTVVPNRNMILLAIAGSFAISRGFGVVAYAAHLGDHAIYPDCRKEFVSAMAATLSLCHYDGGIQLHAPFLDYRKEEIVAEAIRLQVPIEKTWSCYKGQEIHCGRCGTCVERREAFAIAGVEDRTEYEQCER